LKPALIIHLSEDRHRDRAIFFDEHVHLRLAIELQVSVGDLFCQLAFSLARGHDFRFD
jgi:hypothetical protein